MNEGMVASVKLKGCEENKLTVIKRRNLEIYKPVYKQVKNRSLLVNILPVGHVISDVSAVNYIRE